MNSGKRWAFPLFSIVCFGILLLNPWSNFPFVHTHALRYTLDSDHDQCAVAGWTFAILILWYISLVASLIKGGYASFEWGQRLLIYPNFALALLGFIGVVSLLSHYRSHNDDGFAKTLHFINATMLFINTFYCYQIGSKTIPLEHKFGWQVILYSMATFLVLWSGICVLYRQWYSISQCLTSSRLVLSFALFNIVLLVYSFQQVSQQCNKVPYKM